MKSCLIVVAACAVLCGSMIANAEQIDTPPNPAYAAARGFANLMTGWLELPRGLVYENARIPVVGFVSGPIKGAALTTWRTLAGTMDVVCMGLTREGLYTDLVPDFVWDADWVPECGEDLASMETIEGDPCIDGPCEEVILVEPCADPCDPCAELRPVKKVKITPQKKVKKIKVKKWKAR